MEPLDKMQINVGDTVYIQKYERYGWTGIFRHPLYIKAEVTRVTPKRNTIETTYCTVDKNMDLYAAAPEIEKSNRLANAVKYIAECINDFYDKYRNEYIFKQISDNMLPHMVNQFHGTKFTFDHKDTIEKLPKFDLLLLIKEGNKGLTPTNMQELSSLMNKNPYYPFECFGEQEESAMGFISRQFAEQCDFEYDKIKNDIRTILSERTPKSDTDIYCTKDYTMLLTDDISNMLEHKKSQE